MPRTPTSVIKSRSRKLTSAFYSYRPYDDRLGREYNVICTEMAADRVHLVAHNKSYDQILVRLARAEPDLAVVAHFGRVALVGWFGRDQVQGDPEQLLGKCFRVRIEACDKFHMAGVLIPGTVCDHADLVPTAATATSPATRPTRTRPSRSSLYEMALFCMLIAIFVRLYRSL